MKLPAPEQDSAFARLLDAIKGGGDTTEHEKAADAELEAHHQAHRERMAREFPDHGKNEHAQHGEPDAVLKDVHKFAEGLRLISEALGAGKADSGPQKASTR